MEEMKKCCIKVLTKLLRDDTVNWNFNNNWFCTCGEDLRWFKNILVDVGYKTKDEEILDRGVGIPHMTSWKEQFIWLNEAHQKLKKELADRGRELRNAHAEVWKRQRKIIGFRSENRELRSKIKDQEIKINSLEWQVKELIDIPSVASDMCPSCKDKDEDIEELEKGNERMQLLNKELKQKLADKEKICKECKKTFFQKIRVLAEERHNLERRHLEKRKELRSKIEELEKVNKKLWSDLAKFWVKDGIEKGRIGYLKTDTKQFELSEEAKEDLARMKKELNLPDFADKIRCVSPPIDWQKLYNELRSKIKEHMLEVHRISLMVEAYDLENRELNIKIKELDKEVYDVFEFDICDEFDCRRWYCKTHRGYDCGGKFWLGKCIFHREHKTLNMKRPCSECERKDLEWLGRINNLDEMGIKKRVFFESYLKEWYKDHNIPEDLQIYISDLINTNIHHTIKVTKKLLADKKSNVIVSTFGELRSCMSHPAMSSQREGWFEFLKSIEWGVTASCNAKWKGRIKQTIGELDDIFNWFDMLPQDYDEGLTDIGKGNKTLTMIFEKAQRWKDLKKGLLDCSEKDVDESCLRQCATIVKEDFLPSAKLSGRPIEKWTVKKICDNFIPHHQVHPSLMEAEEFVKIEDLRKLIDDMIEGCKNYCFCSGLQKTGISSQEKCANCHSAEQLESLKQKIFEAKVRTYKAEETPSGSFCGLCGQTVRKHDDTRCKKIIDKIYETAPTDFEKEKQE